MNEVRALVEAFDAARVRGERCALATIVSVEGSSYRRPGARMLVGESGSSTGTISAGCLEGDVVEHAKDVLRTGTARLVEYNTASTSEEMAWELGLGCSGLVRVLVEPLASASLYIEALRRSSELAADVPGLTVATVYQCDISGLTGARLVFGEDGTVVHENLTDEQASWAARLANEVRALASDGAASAACVLDVDGVTAKIFLETLLPPIPLVVFGAGQDALPVVRLAQELGWQVEVVDPQARPDSLTRFAIADKVTLARPRDVEEQLSLTPRTMALLMSHSYTHDLELLRFLLASPARYIGVMGPRQRTDRMLSELGPAGGAFRLDEANRSRLHSPVGLDLGANGPAEVALSIVAEMRAVLEGRSGGLLRERQGSIHGSPDDGERVAVNQAPSPARALSRAVA